MKRKNKKNNKKKIRFINKSKRKQTNKKSRHSEKKTIKDMVDLCKPEEYEDYSGYYWEKDN